MGFATSISWVADIDNNIGFGSKENTNDSNDGSRYSFINSLVKLLLVDTLKVKAENVWDDVRG